MEAFGTPEYARIVLLNDAPYPFQSGIAGEQDFEVVPLRELAATTLRLGDQPVSGPIADDEQLFEAVRAAILNLDEGSIFYASRQFPGLHRRIHGTLAELRESGIDSVALEDAARYADGPQRARLEGLAQIEAEVEATLERLHQDLEAWRLKKCLDLETLHGNELPPLLAIAPSDLSPVRRQWLRWWVEQGGNLTLVLEWREGDPVAFPGSARLAEFLEAPIEPLGESNPLATALFTENTISPDSFNVKLQSAADPLSEIEWALRAMIAKNHDGWLWSQMGLFVRNLAETAPLIRSAAKRLGVPLTLNHREPLLANGLARWSVALLKGMADSEPQALIHALRSTYGLRQASGNAALERVEELWLDAQRREADGWTELHRAHEQLGNLFAEAEEADSQRSNWLPTLFAWRGRAVARPLNRIEWLQMLQELVELDPFEHACQGESPTAVRDRRARTALVESVMRRVNVMSRPDERLPFAAIVDEWESLWSAVDTVDVETSNGVRVSAQPEPLSGSRLVAAIGMLEGVFPRRRSEDPILPDCDRHFLSDVLRLETPIPDSHEFARRERTHFLRVCAAPKEQLILSHSTADENRDNVPAFYLSEVQRAMGGQHPSHHHPRGEWTPAPADCLSWADTRLAAALLKPAETDAVETVDDEAVLEMIRPADDEPLAPSELRDVLECPFQTAFRRRLKVRTPERLAARLHQICRAVPLSTAPDAETAHQWIARAIRTELAQASGDDHPAERSLLLAQAEKLAAEWIGQEFSARNLWPKDAGSTVPDVAFDGEILADELKPDGRSIKLKGKVSAVSTMGDYTVVQVYGARKKLVSEPAEKMNDQAKLELGIYFAAARGRRPGVAVEMSATTGERTLFVLDRLDSTPLRGEPGEGRKVVSLNQSETKFLSTAKELLLKAREQLDRNRLEATPGDHCAFCAFGDLCRTAPREAGEEASE